MKLLLPVIALVATASAQLMNGVRRGPVSAPFYGGMGMAAPVSVGRAGPVLRAPVNRGFAQPAFAAPVYAAPVNRGFAQPAFAARAAPVTMGYAAAPAYGYAAPVNMGYAAAAPTYAAPAFAGNAAPAFAPAAAPAFAGNAAPASAPSSVVGAAPSASGPSFGLGLDGDMDTGVWDLASATFDRGFVSRYNLGNTLTYLNTRGAARGDLTPQFDPRMMMAIWTDGYGYFVEKATQDLDNYIASGAPDPTTLRLKELKLRSDESLQQSYMLPTLAMFGDRSLSQQADLNRMGSLLNIDRRMVNAQRAGIFYDQAVAAGDLEKIEAQRVSKEIVDQFAFSELLKFQGTYTPTQVNLPKVYAQATKLDIANRGLADTRDAYAMNPNADTALDLHLSSLGQRSTEFAMAARYGSMIGNGDLSALGWMLSGMADSDYYDLAYDDISGLDYAWNPLDFEWY